MKRILILAFMFFILTGCFAEPSKQAYEKGCGPFPDNYEETIKGYLKTDLYNADSLKNFTVNKPPEKKILDIDYRPVHLSKGQEVWECYIVFDAKGRDGKYIRDFHVVWMRHNRIVAYDFKKIDLGYKLKHRRKDTSAPPVETPGETTDKESAK
ncbi:MAG: hypothetical protein HF978_03790 [Desulfobacteraceae bacterium]|nr:hypothetical protein [Desulfobacteraceae bacterium]MBC2754649.1 hypothetical protein [Desulfobacteraceae bacterium]